MKIIRICFAIILIASIIPSIILPSNVFAVTVTENVTGEGLLTGGAYSGGATNWTNMTSDDGDTTTYWNTGGSGASRTWDTDNFTGMGITGVTIYYKARTTVTSPAGSAEAFLRISGTTYWGTLRSLTAAYVTYSDTWANNPSTGTAWTESEINNMQIGLWLSGGGGNQYATWIYQVVTYSGGISVPTTTTIAASSIATTSAVLNGTIDATGVSAIDNYGFVWDIITHTLVSENVTPAASGYAANWTIGAGSYSLGAISHNTGAVLIANTTYYFRAASHNSLGWDYGSELTFKTIGLPIGDTMSATNVSVTTARLNGTITDKNGQLCDVQFGWDTASHALFADYPNKSTLVSDTYDTGMFPYADVTSLVAGTLYHFRINITNDAGSTLGSDLTFTTSSGVSVISNLTAIPTATTISLLWVKGTGAANTYIRYSASTYPLLVTDGTLGYAGTGNSVSLTGLTPGTTYYITGWGKTGALYSATYITAISTTLAYNSGSTPISNIETPTASSTFAQTPSTTKVSTLPFAGLITANSTAYGTPENMLWYLVWMLIGTGIGIWIYNTTSYNLPATFGTDAIWFGVGATLGLTMMWIVVVFLIIAAGFIMFGERR